MTKWLMLFLILIVGGLYLSWHGAQKFQQWNLDTADGSTIHAYIGVNPLFLIVANTPASIQQGLSGRPTLGADGMLFILPQAQIATFWMKDMQFDLDFVWLSQGKVIETTANAVHPQPGTPDESLKIYSPHEPVDEVLELPAGQVAKLSIKVGDTLEIK